VSNDTYNRQVLIVNAELSSVNLESVSKSILQMQKNTIFNDFEIQNRIKLISIKSGYSSFYRKNVNYTQSRSTNDVILNSLLIDRNYSSVFAQSILKKAIIDNSSSDSLISIYEILKSNSSNITFKPNRFLKASPSQQWDKEEALQLLDIMKKNEKLIF
jgi:hypothetical protein